MGGERHRQEIENEGNAYMSCPAINGARITNAISVVPALILSAACCHAAPTRIACVGDSITKGPYPRHLGELLAEGHDVRNFGIGGIPLVKYDTTKPCGKALALKPDIVIIKLGTNDAHKKN
jgi:hypothetical protein